MLVIRGSKVAWRVSGAQNGPIYRAMFDALAEGKEVKVAMSAFNRVPRLGAGALLVTIGVSTSNWLVLGIGGIVAIWGIYDRCPIWRALTETFMHR